MKEHYNIPLRSPWCRFIFPLHSVLLIVVRDISLMVGCCCFIYKNTNINKYMQLLKHINSAPFPYDFQSLKRWRSCEKIKILREIQSNLKASWRRFMAIKTPATATAQEGNKRFVFMKDYNFFFCGFLLSQLKLATMMLLPPRKFNVHSANSYIHFWLLIARRIFSTGFYY